MRQETLYGAILLGGSALLLITGATHPGSIPWGDHPAIARMAVIDAIAHGAAILGTWLTLLGLVGMSRKLGLQQVPVMAALTAFALAAAAVVVAAALDGFVLPDLVERWNEADKIGGDNLKLLVRFIVLAASALTKIYLLLGALAIALWSWAVYRAQLSAALPWVGFIVCGAAIAVIIGGSVFISAHEVLALVAGQTVWMVLAAGVMLRQPGSQLPTAT